jgi:FkbM family methyltransferase
MGQAAKQTVQWAFRLFGLDLRWYVPHPAHALQTLLKLYEAEAMFDIGANVGMSGEYFRNIGFRGKIVSFEPVIDLYRQLDQKARKDPLWLCENVALGDSEGEQDIYVSGGGGGASSFLVTTGNIEENAPELGVIGRQPVKVKTLQSVMSKYYPAGDRLFLKLDAQGYEKKILEGAGTELARVVGMRIEMSVVKNYEGEPLIYDMLPYLYELGFRLCAIEEAWSNRLTQEVYQVDAILFRPERLSRTSKACTTT